MLTTLQFGFATAMKEALVLMLLILTGRMGFSRWVRTWAV